MIEKRKGLKMKRDGENANEKGDPCGVPKWPRGERERKVIRKSDVNRKKYQSVEL
jgi:hypothetical protein